jgi:hypothetical protein
MQVSGTFPQLSDNQKKQIRKQVSTRSAAGMQRGSVIGGAARRHAGSIAGNRARARQRAGREG